MAIEIGTVEGRIRLVDNFTSELNRVASQLEKQGKKIKKVGEELSDVGGKLTTSLTLPILALGGLATKAATDFESSFAGVRKTVNATEEEFAALAAGMRGMAKEIPVGVDELNRIGESAGQLGIKTENILSFTRVIADLGVTTNLSADAAATALARIANITGLPQEQFDRLGSSIVALGNTFATTEAEIVEFGLRIAGAGSIAGLTEAEILGIGAALSSVGVEAEAGGTAVQQVLLGMTQAVAQGNADLAVFASTAGMSAQQFADAWRENAGATFTAFVEGLGAQGDGAFQTLEKLNLQNQRLIRSFVSLGEAGDLLSRTMAEGTKAFAENVALAKEAEQRYNTFSSRLKIFLNELRDVAITLGAALLPVFRDMLSIARPVVALLASAAEAFARLPKPVQATVVALAGIAAAAGPVLFVAGQLTTAYGSVIAMFPKVAAVFALAGKGIAASAAALTGPVGWIAAGAALLLMIRPVRQAVLDLGGRAMSALREGVSAVVGQFREWWQESAEVRRLMGLVARQLVADLGTALRVVAGALKAVWDWMAKVARIIAEIARVTAGAVVYLLDLSGVLDALATAWEVMSEAAQKAFGWLERISGLADKKGLAKLLAVLMMINPALSHAAAGAAAYGARAVELQERQERLVKVASEVVGETENITLTTEEMDRALRKASGGSGGVGALSDEAQKLADRWRLAAEQSEQLVAAIEQGGRPAFQALQRQIDAANEVAAAGVKPNSDLGRELVAVGVAAAAAARQVEIAVLGMENAEMAQQVAALRAELERLWSTIEARPVDFTLPDPAVGIEVDWEAVEASYREFFGNAEAIHAQYLEGLQDAFADAFRDILKDGELDFEKFFESIADLGINIFAEQLSAALTAALAGAEGAWQDLAKTMKSGAGQAAGWMTAIGIVAGAENTDYAALGAALGTAVGYALTFYSGGWGAPIGAAVGAWLGSMIKKGSPEFYGAIESELGNLEIGGSDLGGGAKQIAKAFEADLQEAMTRILEQIGGTLEGMGGGISLKLKDDKLSVFIDGLEHRFKEDIEAGISFALTEALKRADIEGASQTFVQILQNTTARSLEQLSDALDWGRWYERLRLGDVAADLQERLFKLGQDIRRAIEFGLDLGPIQADFGMDLTAYRNNILGIVETNEERIRREAEQFNRWVQITQAEQQAKEADLLVQAASLRAEIEILRAKMALDEGHLQIRREMLDADLAITTAEWELLQAKLQALAAVEAALATVSTILANLPDLISQGDIDKAIKRARGPRGPSPAEQDFERLNDLLAEAALSQLPEFEQALARINEKWNEAVELAHGNADLIAQITAAREAEIAALERQRMLDFTDSLDAFLSGGGSGSSFVDSVNAVDQRVNELGADLGKLAEDLGLTAFEMLHFWQQVLAGAEHMREALARQGFQDLARGLADLVQDEELRHDLLMQAAMIEFDLRMAQYQLEFDLLQTLGYLTAEQIALLEEGLDNVAAHRDQIIRGMVPVPGGGGGGGPDPADERARALARLRDIQARALDPFSQAIRSVVDEFAELRRVLGWTAEVQAAYAAEIQRVLMEQLEPIRRMQEELAFRSDSPMRSIDQFRLAQQQLNEAVAALAGGDLSQLENIPDLAQLVLDLNPASQASEATRFLFARIQAILDEAASAAAQAVEGIEPGAASDPFAWLRDEPTAGDQLIARTIREIGGDLGDKQDDTSENTGDTRDRLPRTPFDWNNVGVRIPDPPDPHGPESGARRIAAEQRDVEALQRLREIAASNASIDQAIRAGGGVRVGG